LIYLEDISEEPKYDKDIEEPSDFEKGKTKGHWSYWRFSCFNSHCRSIIFIHIFAERIDSNYSPKVRDKCISIIERSYDCGDII
jgi:hypothetical protein